MQDKDIMDDPVYALAINFLENGGELPAKVTNKFVAGLVKVVYHEANEARKSANCAFEAAEKNRADIKEIARSPSLMWYFRNETGKMIRLLSGIAIGLLAGWLGLHLLAHIPGVEAWFATLLNLPVP